MTGITGASHRLLGTDVYPHFNFEYQQLLQSHLLSNMAQRRHSYLVDGSFGSIRFLLAPATS